MPVVTDETLDIIANKFDLAKSQKDLFLRLVEEIQKGSTDSKDRVERILASKATPQQVRDAYDEYAAR